MFEEENALDRLEAFASFHGPDFYRLPRNSRSITLSRTAQTIPDDFPIGGDRLIPIRAGETVAWTAHNVI